MAGADLPCLARPCQSFVSVPNRAWVCTLGTGAQHHRGSFWGHQGQAQEWCWAQQLDWQPTFNISTAQRNWTCFCLWGAWTTLSPPYFHKTYTDASIIRSNLALNFPTQRDSDLSPWSNLSLQDRQRMGGGRACGISCSWFAVCLCNPLSAVQQQTQLRHCCSSGTGQFWPGFTGATTLLVQATCSAPSECVRLCSDKGRREFCHCFSSNTLPMRREKFKKLTDLPC